MQIQTPLVTAIASTAAQATTRERAANDVSSASPLSETIGKTEQSSADRDAQGGGEGLDPNLRKRGKASSKSAVKSTSQHDSGLRAISPEPPSQLDLLG